MMALKPKNVDPNVISLEHDYHQENPTASQKKEKQISLTKVERLKQSQKNFKELLELSKQELEMKKRKLELLEANHRNEEKKIKIFEAILNKLDSVENLLSNIIDK